MKQPEKRVLEVQPGGVTTTAAKGGIVVAAMFLIFGIIFFYVVIGDSEGDEPGLMLLQYAFAAIWVVACGSIIFTNARTLRRGGDPSETSLLHIEETTVPANDAPAADIPAPAAGGDFAARLRDLEGLHRDGLLSDEEYQQKRAEIMKEKW